MTPKLPIERKRLYLLAVKLASGRFLGTTWKFAKSFAFFLGISIVVLFLSDIPHNAVTIPTRTLKKLINDAIQIAFDIAAIEFVSRSKATLDDFTPDFWIKMAERRISRGPAKQAPEKTLSEQDREIA